MNMRMRYSVNTLVPLLGIKKARSAPPRFPLWNRPNRPYRFGAPGKIRGSHGPAPLQFRPARAIPAHETGPCLSPRSK
jgi:hypothetical protein